MPESVLNAWNRLGHDRKKILRQSPRLSTRLDELLLGDLNLPQRSLPRFPFFCPLPASRQPAPPPIIWTSRTGKLVSKALKHDSFFRLNSQNWQQPFPLHPRESLLFLEGSSTSSPGIFPPIFLGKSPGDQVGRFHERPQFLSLSTSDLPWDKPWDVFASLAFKDFVTDCLSPK